HGAHAEFALQQAAHDLLTFGDEDAPLPVFVLPPHRAVRLKLGQIERLDLLRVNPHRLKVWQGVAWVVSSSRTWVAPIFCSRSLTTLWASSGRLHSRLKCPRYKCRSSADMICSAVSAAASFERWPCRPRIRCLRLQGRRGQSCSIFTS